MSRKAGQCALECGGVENLRRVVAEHFAAQAGLAGKTRQIGLGGGHDRDMVANVASAAAKFAHFVETAQADLPKLACAGFTELGDHRGGIGGEAGQHLAAIAAGGAGTRARGFEDSDIVAALGGVKGGR